MKTCVKCGESYISSSPIWGINGKLSKVCINCKRDVKTKTHCENGHLYTAETTRIDKNGWKICRTCKNEAAKRWRDKRVRRID